MVSESRVHGSIFFLLKKFVTQNYSEKMWYQLNAEAGVDESKFEITHNYPLSDINAIIQCASVHTGLTAFKLQETFGEYLVPDLFALYKNYVNPAWTTIDVLENTERVMHGAVRALNSTAHPPILNVMRVNDDTIMIDYFSKRRMSALAIGIIKGIAKYYHEEDNIKVTPITDLEDERVQIRVEFNIDKKHIT